MLLWIAVLYHDEQGQRPQLFYGFDSEEAAYQYGIAAVAAGKCAAAQALLAESVSETSSYTGLAPGNAD